MNKAFKAIWSDARQSFVTTSEIQRSHGKRSKASVTLCLATAMFAATGGLAVAASNNIANTTAVTNSAAQVWETAEYNRDWGLRALNSSSAYELGYHGQNVKVGVMDSGAMLQLEPQLSGDRFHAIVQKGQYGYSGLKYPQHAASAGRGEYTAGESYDLTGQFIPVVNNGHGTHVTGTVGANRDGQEFRGVAWGADIYVANTNATDDINYGPFQDYNYFYNGWKALVDTGAQVINNSFGTNIRTVNRHSTGLDGNDTSTHLQADTVQQSEYEYFYYNLKYGGKPSFVDAAWDAVKGSTTVQVFTTGNRDMANPFYRPAYPYFNPEAESQWIAVAGIKRVGDDNGSYGAYNDTLSAKYELSAHQDEAGIAKWWTVVAPSVNIQSIWAYDRLDENGNPTYRYSQSSGTSMAAPHVTGAMAVILSRYPDMTGVQAREVMLTTAAHTNSDGEIFKDWTAADGVPDVRYGWGVPNLQKGMYGPGQFLSKFDYNLSGTDVWSNDITNVALNARKAEDQEWLNNYDKNLNADDFVLGDGFIVEDGDDDPTNHIISKEDAQKWRKAYFEKRKAAIEARMANDGDGYKGALIKRGQGTLIMTGTNSYEGGTKVLEGNLFGFSESFGAAPVEVSGGTFGLLRSFNDTFTQLGELTSSVGMTRAAVQKANVVVNDGGTYAIVADQDVQVGNLTFNPGSKVTVTSLTDNAFEKAYDGIDQVGTVTADKIEGFNENAVVTPDLALVEHTVTLEGNTLTGILTKNDKTLADYAANSNGVAVANALMADDALLAGLTDATKDEARNTLNSLGNDIHVTANAMTIANGQSLVRAIKDQAIGIDGAAHVADVDGGRARLWLSAVGNWSKMDRAGASKLKADFYTGLVGLEADINANNKVGVFFGAGKTKFKGGHDGKIDSDDLHFGIYGQSKFEPVRLNYGFAYTHQDRDANSALFYKNQAFAASPSYNAKLAQIFGEVAYTGLNLGTVNVEPYVGLAWMHLSADDFSNDYVGGKVSTKFDSQNLAVSNLGARVKVPFEVGPAKFKAVADVNWTQYMGDTRGKSTLKFGNGASATIKSEKLSAVAAVGVGLEAQLGKRASLGVSYYGAYGSKVKSNGVGATFKLAF